MKDIYAELDRLGLTEQIDELPDDVAPVAAETTPLQFLQAVYRNAGLPLNTRIRAGIAAAQYCHPKISVIASPSGLNWVERLEARIREKHKQPKLIEAQPVQQQQRIRRRI
jgi:hypothetical protein